MKITILGGGISGLSLAYFLRQTNKSFNITLIEKTPIFGGWIQSNTQNDFIFEKGPRSLRSSTESAKTTLKLIEELNLKEELIKANPKYVHKRSLWLNNKFQSLPYSFSTVISNPIAWKCAFPAIKEYFVPKTTEKDESISNFFNRRFGKFITENLIEGITLGIYGSDPKKLSIKSCFEAFWNYEQQNGSVVKGMLTKDPKKKNNAINTPYIFSFKKGLQVLPNTLLENLKKDENINIYSQSEIESLKFDNNSKKFTLNSKENQYFESDYVFSTIPSNSLGNIVEDSLSSLLYQIQYTDITVVNIGFKNNDLLKEKYKGFGYLIPPKENSQILGVTFDSCSFPQQNQNENETRITVMIGEKLTKLHKEEKLKEIALTNLENHLELNNLKPDFIKINICKDGIPKFLVGHSDLVEKIQKENQKIYEKKLIILGNAFDKVAVNDCIHNSFLETNKFVNSL